MKKRLGAAAMYVCLFTSLALFFVGNFCTNVGTTYAAVNDPAVIWGSVADQFSTREQVALFVPDHLVRDGKLYLNVQVARPSAILWTTGSSGDWDAAKVSRFRRDHPELESYWPDPEQAGAGVRWLRP